LRKRLKPMIRSKNIVKIAMPSIKYRAVLSLTNLRNRISYFSFIFSESIVAFVSEI
jgi:hypothetical protein